LYILPYVGPDWVTHALAILNFALVSIMLCNMPVFTVTEAHKKHDTQCIIKKGVVVL